MLDTDVRASFRDPVICVTGLASEVTEPGGAGSNPSAFLKVKKSRKFMGIQDDLAVVCAGRALESARLLGAPLGDRMGLYLAVGYIPFRESDIGPVLDASTENGRFSMARFSEEGIGRAHPLLTFKCLPNMPAYHVSVNFDLEGPYLVTYPGPGQLYLALEEAVFALREGRIDAALVGGVAHQRNFLVEHHYRRIEPPVPSELLRDAGAMMVLETEARASARGAAPKGKLLSLNVRYEPHDPWQSAPPNTSSHNTTEPEVGACALPLFLSQAWGSGGKKERVVRHTLVSRDSIYADSEWALSEERGDEAA